MNQQCKQCARDFESTHLRKFCNRKCYRLSVCSPLSLEERIENDRSLRRIWKGNNQDKIKRSPSYLKSADVAREWRKRNPERVAELMKQSHERFKERMKDSQQRYALSERGRRAAERHRRKIWSDPTLRILRIVKAAFVRAIRNDVEFDQCLKEILPANPPTICICCGVVFNYNEDPSKTRKRNSPSIDRVENGKGYVVGNVQIICWGCNEDKSHLTVERMEQFIAYIKSNVGKFPCEVTIP